MAILQKNITQLSKVCGTKATELYRHLSTPQQISIFFFQYPQPPKGSLR